MIRHQCGRVGVRVGEAANPGPSGSVDEELLDCLQCDLTRGGGVPRRMRRRVMDSDSDAPLLQADSDADQNPQVPALTSPPEGCGRRDMFDDASMQQPVMDCSPVSGCVEGKKLFHQNHFHQKKSFIKIHFHQKPISSKNHFHQRPLSSETLSSKPLS